MTTIGFIGLGHMGHPMVKNLLKNNHTVTVYDLSADAISSLVDVGAVAGTSPADIAKAADIVITMLQTGEQVKKVCSGAEGIFAHLKKSALFIDCSSIDVDTSKTLHEIAASQQIAMLDAPVSGGVLAAEKASLTFMVGGAANDFERAKPVLQTMGKKIIRAGEGGSGVAAKICNNMLLGISMIGASEAFVLADKLGLAADKLFEICSNSSGQCWSLTQYCPWPGILPDSPASHDYKPGFTAKMMLKDLNLSQAAAKSAHAATPLGQLATLLYQHFVDGDHAEKDFSGIIRMLKDMQH
jgi:3-hydroxyisobutyrate dehydrogenase